MSEKLEFVIERAKEGNSNIDDLNWYELDTLKEMIEKERKNYTNLSNPFLTTSQKEIFNTKIKNLDKLVKSIDELQQEVITKKENRLKEKYPVRFGLLGTLALAVGAIGMASDISEKISNSIPVNYPSDEDKKEDEVED